MMMCNMSMLAWQHEARFEMGKGRNDACKKMIAAALLSCVVLTGNARAAEVVADASAGSTGLGLHASIQLTRDINFRLGGNYLKPSSIKTNIDGDTNVDVTLRTFDALLDWYPQDNSFHLSAGLVYNGNKISTQTRLSGSTYKGTLFAPCSALWVRLTARSTWVISSHLISESAGEIPLHRLPVGA